MEKTFFFCLPFITTFLALLLFFSPYLIEPGLILRRYFSLNTVHFLIPSINHVKSFSDRLTNAAAERTSHPCSLLFHQLRTLFPPSASTLVGPCSKLSVCGVTSLRCSRLRLQQRRCRWCKVMQNLQNKLLFFVHRGIRLSNASIRLSHYRRVKASTHVNHSVSATIAKLNVYFVFLVLRVEYRM